MITTVSVHNCFLLKSLGCVIAQGTIRIYVSGCSFVKKMLPVYVHATWSLNLLYYGSCTNINYECNWVIPTVQYILSNHMYTEQNYKRNTFVFAPFFMSWTQRLFLCTQNTYFSQILFTNLSKSVLVSTSPLPRESIHLTSYIYIYIYIYICFL